jgi:hypothetical protein
MGGNVQDATLHVLGKWVGGASSGKRLLLETRPSDERILLRILSSMDGF